MIISPYTIEGNKSPSPDIPWKLAERLVRMTPVQPNDKRFVVKSNMYPVDGTDQDWFYNEHGTIAYIIEGSHHNPANMDIRKQSVRGIAPIFRGLVEHLYSAPAIEGYVTNANGEPLEASVRIKEHRFYSKENWTSRPYDGHFYRLLLKRGSYTLLVAKEGYQTAEVKVQVGKTRAEKNIVLIKKGTQ